jgi:alkylation response protein AidB-like acyl-CoA dehydrogenase
MMPQLMFDDPDGTFAMLRESAVGFASRYPGPKALRDKRRRGGNIDKAIWSAMAEAGWTGLLLPEALGGTGLGIREQAVLSEALGQALVAEPVAMASVFSGSLLADAPNSAERARLVAGIARGSVIAMPAWRDAARPVRSRTAPAGTAGNDIVLRGEKAFVDAARSATDFLVTAEGDDGCILVSIAADAAGLIIIERPGIDGTPIAVLSFADCHIPASRLLARAVRPADLLDRPVLQTRLALAAELAGLASKALELTIAYAKDRVQFGKPIASFQAIQHRLVDMWIDAEFACAAVVNAVNALEAGNGDAARLAVLAAKARAGEAAFSICRRAVHLYGAMGFTDECDIGLYLKRAIALNATLGQPEELRLQFVELESGFARGRKNGKQADQDRDPESHRGRDDGRATGQRAVEGLR